ncbi:MAG: cyclopropane-fatty-acyl-phospholipid synthase family protein [Vicinamibacterales bacterium]
MSLERYYASLSRFQDLARRVGHDTGQREMTVHRRLLAPDGRPSGTVVHERLLAALAALAAGSPLPAAPRILDAGCGLGGTTFFLARAVGGDICGITLSPVQRDRAEQEARKRGAVGCRFVVRSYDEPLDDLLPDGADLIVAIESLAHAPDPAATIGRLAARLRPGGRLAVVDDMPADGLPLDDPDLTAFRRGWLCPAVAPASALRRALSAAGAPVAADVDLTALVPRRGPRSLAWRLRLSGLGRRLGLPAPVAVLVESLHGGLALERLYQRGAVEYRLLVGVRPGRG